MPRNVVFYTTETGKRPVEQFLDSLESKEAQKISWVLKKLTGTEEIWECRVRTKSKAIRIFGFFVNGDTLVLTHGYAKKSQRTDARQIKLAENYRRDYFARNRRLS
jgi:phage-related protein